MSWFSKKLKKVTKIADPIGHKLRKSTGGSYGDPMNWYNSKPNQTIPYEKRTSPGLISAPGGPAPQGTQFGANTGGYNYLQNRFAGASPGDVPPAQAHGGPPVAQAPAARTPGVLGGGAMSFGGGGIQPAPSGWGGRGGNAMAQAASAAMQHFQPQQMQSQVVPSQGPRDAMAQNPQMQQQMMRIGALRGGNV